MIKIKNKINEIKRLYKIMDECVDKCIKEIKERIEEERKEG